MGGSTPGIPKEPCWRAGRGDHLEGLVFRGKILQEFYSHETRHMVFVRSPAACLVAVLAISVEYDRTQGMRSVRPNRC